MRGDPPHIVCWFNAWMHSDAPNLGPALAAAVGKAVAETARCGGVLRTRLRQEYFPPEERRRRRVLMLAFAALAAVIVVFAPKVLIAIFRGSTDATPWSADMWRWTGATVLAGIPVAASPDEYPRRRPGRSHVRR